MEGFAANRAIRDSHNNYTFLRWKSNSIKNVVKQFLLLDGFSGIIYMIVFA
jgi:hypothetical protein